MARNWKKYYKRRYKKYYKNKYGNTYGSRGYGQMKAAKQQADQASFVMNIPTQISCKCVRGTVGNRQVELGTYPMNIYDLLRKSEFYQSYANMYDEFKIDNIKVKLIPIKYNVTVGDVNNAGYQSFTVYTAWDRTGLNGKQLYLNTASGVYNNEPINPNAPNGAKNYDYIGKPGDYDGIYCLVGSDITTYSSAESRQVSVGQNSSIVRWLKPKTLAEKSQWLSTAQLKAWYNQYSNADAMFRYIPTSDMNSYLSDISKLSNLNDRSIGAALNNISPAIANNPCFLEEDPSVSFKPTLLVGLYPADPENTELPRTVFFNVETEVSCSFRGLRKSKVVNNEDIFQPLVPPEPQPQPEIDLEPLNVTQFGNYARGDPDTEGFNPVSVAPAQGSYVQNVFDNNEISEEDLQNMALQSLPNESEVHYINTEIPHQQNDYIPSATITKYRVGHYQFTENGTSLMSYAGQNVDPETPNVWVIPGVIDINVPPPQMDQNENIIVANGVYNLVNNDEDPGIEIEPENQNNTTRNFPIIKSRPTVKSFKLVSASESRDDNDSRDDVPISLGQIRVNVKPQFNNLSFINNGEPVTINGIERFFNLITEDFDINNNGDPKRYKRWAAGIADTTEYEGELVTINLPNLRNDYGNSYYYEDGIIIVLGTARFSGYSNTVNGNIVCVQSFQASDMQGGTLKLSLRYADGDKRCYYLVAFYNHHLLDRSTILMNNFNSTIDMSDSEVNYDITKCGESIQSYYAPFNNTYPFTNVTEYFHLDGAPYPRLENSIFNFNSIYNNWPSIIDGVIQSNN